MLEKPAGFGASLYPVTVDSRKSFNTMENSTPPPFWAFLEDVDRSIDVSLPKISACWLKNVPNASFCEG